MKRKLIPFLLSLSLLGCLAPGPEEEGGGGATAGVAMYAWDHTSQSVLVWKDLGAVYDASTLPEPTYTLSHSYFSNVTPLAWNGLAFDASNNQLYLVGETGEVVRISSIRRQTGAISNADISTFKLDTSSRLQDSKFGQAAVDPSSGALYISENGSSSARIWAVSNARTLPSSGTATLVDVKVDSGQDTGGYGVTAGRGYVFGSFTGGDPVGLTDPVSGPRLRRGSTPSGPFAGHQNVLIGSATLLGKYAPLAFDTSSSNIYVGVYGTGDLTAGKPVLRFTLSQFGGAYNQAPADSFGIPADHNALRFMAHPGSKDWLVAGPEGGTQLWIWKQPSAGGTQYQSKTLGGSRVVRGVALDPNP